MNEIAEKRTVKLAISGAAGKPVARQTRTLPRVPPLAGLIFLLGSTAWAGVNSWTSVGPDTAAIDSLSVCPGDPSKIFVVSGTHIYRSTDRGTSWRRLRNLALEPGENPDIICHPVDSRRVYVSSNGLLVSSTDQGEKWTVVGRDVYYPTVDPRNPDTLFAVRDSDFPSFQRSTDGGFTWTPLLLDSASISIVDPRLSGVLYLVSWERLLKSTDGGRNWSVTGLDAGPEIVLVDPADSERLFAATSGALSRSIDGGDTWTDLFLGPGDYPTGPPPFPGINAIVLEPGDPEVVYLGTNGGLYKSSDAGQTWAATAFSQAITNLTFMNDDPYNLIAATPVGVFKISADVSNWVPSSSGLRGGTFWRILTHPTATNHLYATDTAQFFASKDGGRNWVARVTGIDQEYGIRAVAVDPTNPAIVYLGTEKNQIYKSTDLGLTWSHASQGIASPGVWDMVIDPQHPNVLYAAGFRPYNSSAPEATEDIYKSTDGGAIWAAVNRGLPVKASSLAIDPVNPMVLYAATREGVHKTTDGGADWNLVLTMSSGVSPAGLQVSVDQVNPEIVYAVGYLGFYRSTDSGVNWTFYPLINIEKSGVMRFIGIDPRHSEILYLGATSGLWRSTDSGKSWTPLSYRGRVSPNEPSSANVYDLHVAKTGTVYVCGLGLGVLAYTAPDFLTVPRLVNKPGGEMTGLALSNVGLGEARLTVSAIDASGGLIQAPGITNPVDVLLQPGQQRAWLAHDLFGPAFRETDIKGWLRVHGEPGGKITGFFSLLTPDLSVFDTAAATKLPLSSWLFSEVGLAGRGELWLVNPNDHEAEVLLELRDPDGSLKKLIDGRSIGAGGVLTGSVREIFDIEISPDDSVRVLSDQALVGLHCLKDGEANVAAIRATDPEAAGGLLFAPQYAAGPEIRTRLTVVNPGSEPGTLTLQLFGDDGQPVGNEKTVAIGGHGKVRISEPAFFGLADGQSFSGYVRVHSPWVKLAGSVVFSDPDSKRFSAALPLVGPGSEEVLFSHLVSTAEHFTGLAVLNPGMEAAQVTIEVLTANGSQIAQTQLLMDPGQRRSLLLTEFFRQLAGQSLTAGAIRVRSNREVTAYALFGDNNLNSLSALPGQ
ncbi:MAG: hypothetical protein EHM23_11490 [Acidobacteria bacterium]|nr:MAG: hypothetical protein EHM23_11490 [Acidobacteriota bacterium]